MISVTDSDTNNGVNRAAVFDEGASAGLLRDSSQNPVFILQLLLKRVD